MTPLVLFIVSTSDFVDAVALEDKWGHSIKCFSAPLEDYEFSRVPSLQIKPIQAEISLQQLRWRVRTTATSFSKNKIIK